MHSSSQVGMYDFRKSLGIDTLATGFNANVNFL